MADVAETIEESGRRIGSHAWVEARLFEIVGRWSGTVPEPRARALFASQSHHHAWHAELWHDLLPALPHVATDAFVAPAAGDAALISALEELDAGGDVRDGAASAGGGTGGRDGGAEGPGAAGNAGGEDDGRLVTLGRLTVLYRRVLPELAARYADHLARTTPVTDGPAIRVLRLVTADIEADTAEGEALIEALGGPHPPA
mgnify:FL=1